jgi:hypothetical protein
MNVLRATCSLPPPHDALDEGAEQLIFLAREYEAAVAGALPRGGVGAGGAAAPPLVGTTDAAWEHGGVRGALRGERSLWRLLCAVVGVAAPALFRSAQARAAGARPGAAAPVGEGLCLHGGRAEAQGGSGRVFVLSSAPEPYVALLHQLLGWLARNAQDDLPLRSALPGGAGGGDAARDLWHAARAGYVPLRGGPPPFDTGADALEACAAAGGGAHAWLAAAVAASTAPPLDFLLPGVGGSGGGCRGGNPAPLAVARAAWDLAVATAAGGGRGADADAEGGGACGPYDRALLGSVVAGAPLADVAAVAGGGGGAHAIHTWEDALWVSLVQAAAAACAEPEGAFSGAAVGRLLTGGGALRCASGELLAVPARFSPARAAVSLDVGAPARGGAAAAVPGLSERALGSPYATLARAVAAFGKRLADVAGAPRGGGGAADVAGAPRGGGGAIDNEWASATAQLVRDIAHAVERLLLDGYPLASLGACRATPGAYEGGGGGGGRCGTLFAPTSPDGLALHGVTEQVPPAAVPLLRWAALALLALSRHSPLAAGGCVWDASLYSAVDGVVLAYARHLAAASPRFLHAEAVLELAALVHSRPRAVRFLTAWLLSLPYHHGKRGGGGGGRSEGGGDHPREAAQRAWALIKAGQEGCAACRSEAHASCARPACEARKELGARWTLALRSAAALLVLPCAPAPHARAGGGGGGPAPPLAEHGLPLPTPFPHLPAPAKAARLSLLDLTRVTALQLLEADDNANVHFFCAAANALSRSLAGSYCEAEQEDPARAASAAAALLLLHVGLPRSLCGNVADPLLESPAMPPGASGAAAAAAHGVPELAANAEEARTWRVFGEALRAHHGWALLVRRGQPAAPPAPPAPPAPGASGSFAANKFEAEARAKRYVDAGKLHCATLEGLFCGAGGLRVAADRFEGALEALDARLRLDGAPASAFALDPLHLLSPSDCRVEAVGGGGGSRAVLSGAPLLAALRAKAAQWRLELAEQMVAWVTAGGGGGSGEPSISEALFEGTLLQFSAKARALRGAEGGEDPAALAARREARAGLRARLGVRAQ